MELRRKPSEEQLRHGLVLVERLLNARPLTEIPADEEEECLTPNHFLVGSSNGLKSEETESTCSLPEALGQWQELLQRFWERFTKEYLPTISRRSKWQKETEPLSEGDLVLLGDDDCRVGWLRGIVSKVFVDNESGQVLWPYHLQGNTRWNLSADPPLNWNTSRTE